jgi:hypothetical protein
MGAQREWVCLHSPEDFAALEQLVAFCIEKDDTVVPHAAFASQTPGAQASARQLDAAMSGRQPMRTAEFQNGRIDLVMDTRRDSSSNAAPWLRGLPIRPCRRTRRRPGG